MSKGKSFLQSAKIVSFSTLLSRVLGLVRVMFASHIFGRSDVWGAFSFAWMVPNLFRNLFGEGAVSSAFIPTLTRYIKSKDPRETRELISVVSTALLIVLSAIVVIGEIGCLAAQGIFHFESTDRLSVFLIAILLPYLILICFAALLTGVHNSMGRFGLPALMPSVLNVFWIASMILIVTALSRSAEELKIAVVAASLVTAGVFQAMLQLIPLKMRNFAPRFKLDLSHPGLKEIYLKMLPLMLGLSIYQINVLADNLIARAFIQFKAVSSLFYATRLFQFPYALIGTSIGVAIFPHLAGLSLDNKKGEIANTLAKGVRAIFFLAVPATIGLIIIRKPLIGLIYQHGSFTADDTGIVSRVLLCYVLGLAGLSCLAVFVRTFYSFGDTKTPVSVGLKMVFANIILNIILIQTPLKEAGLALATSVTGTAQAIILFLILRKRNYILNIKGLGASVAKILAASAVMGVITWVSLLEILQVNIGKILFNKIAYVLVPIIIGFIAYMAVCRVINVAERKIVFHPKEF